MKPTDSSNLSTDKSLEAMWQFSQTYAKRTGTYFCAEPSVTAVVIEGLAKHKDDLGAPLCPCRHYEDKQAEAGAAFWNCPCVPMRERKECHCMLFLTPDNEFAGDKQDIPIDAIKEVRSSMG
ncbi:ferredoxin thioredoxin reductase catalytic beta subunit [Gloeocapsopsis dulcis]|uniref:Ferredoxin-thioredoxin reductase, catalytic chain n=1 Tax=Gloeocapsopsis dulcis AAB1 = 1H9 TaxID=1433147 RepID=A0A6N8FQ60_9CHRO|nr:ferredoxin thioredoxin reductase catalytic beta subunit [Gloeocapsopsis dulcis]MUL35363.1 ferredoxin--nitrite reductase [Gloeocapsopsis dulcis AAB1 = 1H9]WNN90434.1 ferredoxin-thioredoxin reductase catalytic domain-containing protein [Gloeocapsopsis dulcis]